MLDGDPHIPYFNRHFGYILRPSRTLAAHDPYVPGLHHFCLRVDSVADVVAVATQLRSTGVEASVAKLYPEYAPDYWATYSPTPMAFATAAPAWSVIERGAERELEDTTGN